MRFLTLCLVLAWTCWPLSNNCSSCVAQQDDYAEEDSSARRILDEHLKALGDPKTLAKIKSAITVGDLQLAGVDLKFELKKWQADGKYLLQLKSEEVEIWQGFDGEVVWEKGPTGNRILEAEERIAAIANNALIVPALTWSSGDFAGKIKLTGRKTLGKKHCFSVDFVPTKGHVVRRYFDPDSYMILRYQTKQKLSTQNTTELTVVDILVKDSDYRPLLKPFESIQFPYKQQFATNNKLTYTITRNEIRINEQIDPARFALPPEISLLLK